MGPSQAVYPPVWGVSILRHSLHVHLGAVSTLILSMGVLLQHFIHSQTEVCAAQLDGTHTAVPPPKVQAFMTFLPTY